MLSQAANAEYKEILLREYIDDAENSELRWALYILSGRKLNKCFNISEIWDILPELSGIPDWLIEESLNISSDKTEVISLLLNGNNAEHKISLTELMNDITLIDEAEGKLKPEKVINILKNLNSAEKYLFLRLISGNFRPPIKFISIVNVLSKKFSINKLSVCHLLNSFDPHESELVPLINTYKKNKKIFKTFDFKNSINTKLNDIGEIDYKNWFAEWKWDGLRVHLVYRNGEFMIWNKDEELITEKFPEFFEFSKYLPDGTVIDGEIIAFSNGKPLHHSILAGRLNKKLITNKMIDDHPAAFIAFDILEYNGKEIVNNNLSERREILEKVIEKINHTGRIYISPLLEFRTIKTLNELKNSAAENNCKGIILKKKNSEYSNNDNWLSIDADKYSINGILLYAQKDLNSDFYSEFTFGVWKNDELITFTKTRALLNSDEITEIKAFIKDNTLEKFGPVRTVKPELVFEILFDGISVSSRHKSGITLRNPQIHKWHKNKKSHEAGHLLHLKELLNAGK